MKIFKTKKYSILSNILKFSFVGVLAVMFIFPTLFINNFVKNTEAVYTGVYAQNTTSTSVTLKAFGLTAGIDYFVDLGMGEPGTDSFKADASIDIISQNVGVDGTYIWTMNHPTGYMPGTIYNVVLNKLTPPTIFNVANSSVTIPANTGTPAGGEDTGTPAGGEDTGGTNITTKILNPLGDKITDIPSFIEAIINIVLIVGIPIVALAIIYTGFLFVGAQGNPEKITKAKKALLYTLIGGALLLGAFVIAKAIGVTVEEIKSTT